jgi:hypothetical protein
MIPSSRSKDESVSTKPGLIQGHVTVTCHYRFVPGYDIIGDVHGNLAKFEELLRQLGYVEGSGAFQHPERQAVFVGDLIDRGDENLRVVALVRAMVESGAARVIMGNHEFNAIAYATDDPADPGKGVR